jgi:hypothetical protein
VGASSKRHDISYITLMLDLHTEISATGDAQAGDALAGSATMGADAASIALLDTLSEGIAAVVDRIGPAVVRVETAHRGRSAGGLGSGSSFRRMGSY